METRKETHEFLEQIASARARVASLHRDAGEPAIHKNGLLPELFTELNISLEELRVSEEELRQQNEMLGETRLAVEEERQRYQDLFDFAPDGYLVTDADGKILEANRAAGLLLGVLPRHLANKPLAVYVAPESRPAFRAALIPIAAGGRAGGVGDRPASAQAAGISRRRDRQRRA